MSRYFTLQQAERVLPAVESSLREALRLKEQYQSAEEQIREVTRKVMVSGGMMLNRERVSELRTSRDAAAGRLQAALDALHEHGCLVKDLDIGLLDFPTLYQGREVYLCWRLGESRIEFWHEVEEGFRGRRRIDDDFLANHRGEPAG